MPFTAKKVKTLPPLAVQGFLLLEIAIEMLPQSSFH
jgi:hypothetical protein